MNRVSFAMQHNCRYTDRWPSRKLLFKRFQIWITHSGSVAISIRMDNNVDKVRIIEAASRFIKNRISKLPVRTPKFPGFRSRNDAFVGPMISRIAPALTELWQNSKQQRIQQAF